MRKGTLTVLIAGFVLAPALVIAQKTSHDFDKTANFAGFKTYAFKDGTKVGQPLIDDRIVAALEKELAAKGLRNINLHLLEVDMPGVREELSLTADENVHALLTCARELQSRFSANSDAGEEKMRSVEKTSKNALTPKRGFAYKPPIETATPLATPSPPRFSGTLGLVADDLG